MCGSVIVLGRRQWCYGDFYQSQCKRFQEATVIFRETAVAFAISNGINLTAADARRSLYLEMKRIFYKPVAWMVPANIEKTTNKSRRRWPFSLPWVYCLQKQLYEQVEGDPASGGREAVSQLSVVPYLLRMQRCGV